jgi:hypothetical protein
MKKALMEPTSAAVEAPVGVRRRAQGKTVALTVRVSRADWARLHQLAVAEGVSLQALALTGLSKVFTEHGLPPMTS